VFVIIKVKFGVTAAGKFLRFCSSCLLVVEGKKWFEVLKSLRSNSARK
jgi:hypothetical protein